MKHSGLRLRMAAIYAGLVGGNLLAWAWAAIDRFHLKGPLWESVGALDDHFDTIGFLIIGVFVVCWMLSAVICLVRGYDQLDARAGG